MRVPLAAARVPLCAAARAPSVAMRASDPSSSGLGRLAVFGATGGPLVDAVHNQALLQYDILPLAFADVRTSWLIPPLLALTYALLGGVLATRSRDIFSTAVLPSELRPRQRALLAVSSTVVIIKASELLALSALPTGQAAALLLAAAIAQWAALDGALATLLLALLVSICGPLAELPFIGAGCWHYLQPDFWPLEPLGLGPGSWAGLSGITGPCYFAVTYACHICTASPVLHTVLHHTRCAHAYPPAHATRMPNYRLTVHSQDGRGRARQVVHGR